MGARPATRAAATLLLAALALAPLASCTTVGGDASPASAVPSSSDCAPKSEATAARVATELRADASAPEAASGYRTGLRAVIAQGYLVVSAHPLASRAGCQVLAAGGSAVDAAVAVQAVLGLVEPQSSGLGGGAFLLSHDPATDALQSWDGRETAPAAAREDDLLHVDGRADPSPPQPSARASGRSIGTPGVLRLLEAAHRAHGRLPWRDLFQPAIRLARDGFPIGPRLAEAIAAARDGLAGDAEAAATYLDADGAPRAAGTWLRVPAYADTLQAVAEGGADAFYRGPIAAAIVEKIGSARRADDGAAITPGRTTAADLAAYRAVPRPPVCAPYRAWWVCGVGPPSSGGIAVLQTLGILASFDLAALASPLDDGRVALPSVAAVHLVSEAERLAYADRDRYVADTDHVALPGGRPAALLDPHYLRERARLIRIDRSMGTAAPGVFGAARGEGPVQAEAGTSHLSIVDARGGVVAMTTSVESAFGSLHMARGVVLNNQLTDFAVQPVDARGVPVANRLQAGKRPRSSMAPTLVFRRNADGSRGAFVLATGSPGGARIIPYVVKTLVAVLDWSLDAQQAAEALNFGAANTPLTFLGGEHPALAGAAASELVGGLRARGHAVSTNAQPSGVATIVRLPAGPGRPLRWQGGVDPRREGLALGGAVR